MIADDSFSDIRSAIFTIYLKIVGTNDLNDFKDVTSKTIENLGVNLKKLKFDINDKNR